MTILPWTLSHRPNRDGSIPSADVHITFVEAIEAADDAWHRAFDAVTATAAEKIEIAAVNATGNFRHELFVGPAECDVRLVALGRRSLTWMVEILQSGRSAATVTIVVSRVTPDRSRSEPLSAAHRALLEPLLEPRPDDGGRA